MENCSLRYKLFSTKERQGGGANVNLGPPNISEITRDIKLKLKSR